MWASLLQRDVTILDYLKYHSRVSPMQYVQRVCLLPITAHDLFHVKVHIDSPLQFASIVFSFTFLARVHHCWLLYDDKLNKGLCSSFCHSRPKIFGVCLILG